MDFASPFCTTAPKPGQRLVIPVCWALLVGFYSWALLVGCITVLNLGGFGQAVPYTAFVGVTCNSYNNFARKEFDKTSNGLLRTRSVSNKTGTSMYLECLKWCVVTPNCHSFVMHPARGLCYLHQLDRCASPKTSLTYNEGFISYDVRPVNATGLPKTCFERCLNSTSRQTCGDCGRHNCVDDWCGTCPSKCWELHNLTTEETSLVLWPTMGFMKETVCDGEWQGISNNGWPMDKVQLRLDDEVWLRIIVVDKDGSKFVAYFDKFDISTSKALTVGNYLGGNASNFWKAPFDKRPRSVNKSTNCASFYYAEDDCHAYGVDSYADQFLDLQNDTLIKRALSWESCHAKNITVQDVQFFISNSTELLEDVRAQNETLERC